MSSAPLHLTLAPPGCEHALLFSRLGGELAIGRPDPDRLGPLKACLSEELAAVKRQLQPDGGILTWRAAHEAVVKLKKLGGWLLHDLLGKEWRRAEELENFLRYVAGESNEGASGAVETRIKPSNNCPRGLRDFPFELLPLFGRALPAETSDLPGLAQAVSGVLGYATVVVRHGDQDTFPDAKTPFSGGLRLRRDPHTGLVPVVVFREEKNFAAVTKEIAYIAFGTHTFQVVARWPTQITPPPEDDLARTMFAKVEPGAVSPQVLHFSCHYGSSTGEFRFSDESNALIEITLNELKSARARLNGARQAPPLVFLNACQSSAFDPAGAISLIEMLREEGNAAVIGAEVKVPDHAGSFFARRVFARLASGGSLGLAVLRARWDLIEEWRSVAGIFFSLHGRTDLRVG